MRLSFPVPSTRHPVGGIAITYEFAEALARRGHEVTILHHELFGGDAVAGLHEIAWYEFDATVGHHFVDGARADVDALPDADIFVGHSPEIEANPRLGLPVKMIQGWRMYPEDQELAAYRSPCPKACVARWLIRIGEELGVDRRELVHTPIALHTERFHLSRPIDDRPPHLAFCWNVHPMKGGGLALEVARRVHAARPDTRISAFGTTAPPTVPDWLDFHREPARDVLVDEIYNTASVFLCTSVVEGFGLTNLEAMACGAALVTTDCGGIEDYVDPGTTGLVGPVDDADRLVAHVLALLDDDPLRIGIARAGHERALTFTWDRSAALMERFFVDYLADPAAFGRPSG